MDGILSLDDSLTSIQWLCQLESTKLLEENDTTGFSNKEPSKAATEVQKQDKVDKNPYPKPHHSYATLIVLAINSSQEKRMALQEIYAWIQENYPYYKFAKKGWKNSIRHNLSLHKFFIKEKRPTVLHGKGSFWRISPEGKENLMRDLFKQGHHNLQTPYALLPHDLNRKLRPIMPKPYGDAQPAVQYVPYLPVVFVPGNSMPSIPMGNPIVATGTQVVVAESGNTIQNINGPMADAQCDNMATDLNTNVVAHTTTVRTSKENNGQSSKAKMTPESTSSTKNNHTSPNIKQSSKNKASKTRELPNILRRKKKSKQMSPVVAKKKERTPTRSNSQPTLAAINSSQSTTYSPKRNLEDLVSTLNDLTSSPLRHNTSFDFFSGFGSPGFSPLCSPGQFRTGLTPVRNDSDSGIMMTPLKSSFGDLSWTPFKTGFTPIMVSPTQSDQSGNTPQRCRKQLGLDLN